MLSGFAFIQNIVAFPKNIETNFSETQRFHFLVSTSKTQKYQFKKTFTLMHTHSLQQPKYENTQMPNNRSMDNK